MSFTSLTCLNLTVCYCCCYCYCYCMGRYLWGGDRSYYVAGLKVRHIPPLEQDTAHLPARVSSYTVLSAMQAQTDDRASRLQLQLSGKISAAESQRQQMVDRIAGASTPSQREAITMMKKSKSTLLLNKDDDKGSS